MRVLGAVEAPAPSRSRFARHRRRGRRCAICFAKITAPTLILKADAQGDLRTQNEEVARVLAKGKIVHITGAGHNVRRENKAQTIEVMRAFLNGT